MAFRNFFLQHWSIFLLFFGIILYCVYFITVTFLRHDNFYSGRYDLGNMDQVVWNTLNGNFFEATYPDAPMSISRLSGHADFLLVFLSPFYLIWQNPKMLLLIQTLVLSLGALFVNLIAQSVLNNKKLSLAFSFLYLLNPSMQYTNLYDFHAVTLSTTFLLAAFYFVHKRNYIPFTFFLLLAATSKEQIWIISIIFGFYVFFLQKKKWLGLIITLLGLSFFYYFVWHAIPSVRGDNHFALSFYSEFGNSPSSVLKNILFSPLDTVLVILSADKIHYLYQLFMPLGLLSLFAPLFLIFAVPDLGINLLSNNTQLHQIYYQYTSAITPFLFISAIFGLKKFFSFFPKVPSIVMVLYLLFCTLYIAYLHGPLPGAKNPSLDMIKKQRLHRNDITAYLHAIPKEKSIAAINNIGAHVSQREFIYTIPLGLEEADVIIFDLEDPFSLPSPEIQYDMIENLNLSNRYVLVLQKGNFYAFEKVQTQK